MVNPSQFTIKGLLVEQIRNEIIRGAFPPGSRLRLRDLANRFEVSIQPIREALSELESEGLVHTVAHKGSVVTSLTMEEITDIYEMRATLEAMATRLAVPLISTEAIDELESLSHAMAAEGADAVTILDLNKQFHNKLNAASGRKHLCANIEMQRNRTAHYFHGYMEDLEYSAHVEHLEIVQACRNNNPERAAKVMQQHILAAGTALVRKQSALPPSE